LTSSIVVGADQARRQRVAEQIGDRHLRLAVLDALLHLARRVAGEQAQQRRDDGLAAAGAAHQAGSAAAPRG
jgi:hypothetical protein